MKGWQFTEVDAPLKLVEQADPVAEPGMVVLNVEAAGICHSDVGVLRDPGWAELMSKVPVIMGHEVAGTIIEVGEGVSGFKVGDKVGVSPLAQDGKAPGYGRDGGFANKIAVPAVDLAYIPEGVSFAQAAAGTDAGLTTYHAVFTQGKVEPGMRVGIVGVGGLGQIAVQACLAKDCTVYAADTSENAREHARKIGAKEVVEQAKELAEFEPDVIIDFAGFGETTSDSLEAVAYGGRVVLVGMGKLETTINSTNLITKQATLIGSNGGSVEELEEVYKMMAEGSIDPLITEITFDEIPEGIQQLEDNKVTGRLVAIIHQDDFK